MLQDAKDAEKTIDIDDLSEAALNDPKILNRLDEAYHNHKRGENTSETFENQILEILKNIIGRAERLKRTGVVFDGAWMWSDMAYKNTTYFSPGTYKKLLHKYHIKLCGYFKKNAMPVILHSDGNCASFIPLYISAGVRALNPLEIDSGFSDAEFLKKEYGKGLVLFGNMPALVLEKSKKEIMEVFKKRLEILKAGGGFIYHGDKPIPETVSSENYQFALDIVKKYGKY